MASHQHSRSFGSSPSSHASSYTMILDHILTYPGAYEIPLRTMYSLNCGPRTSAGSSPSASSNTSSPTLAQPSLHDTPTRQTLTENLMSQLSQLPNQSSTLPPTFITAFVQKCFPSHLPHVDFPQALTGLDYLKDLESRRRKEVAAVFGRLEISRDALDQDALALTERYPGLCEWVKTIEDKERKFDALYTQVYVGLRRWILINELSLLPFHKHNCIAMLNTLYPPAGIAEQAQPTGVLTPAVLKGQRDGFFKYIQAVETSGPRILTNLMQQGKASADVNGWPAVVRNLTMYLQAANSMLKECEHILDVEDVSPRKNRETGSPRHARKADSGISFTSNASVSSERRLSTRSSEKEPPSPIEWNRPKTPSGAKSGSALEKLARGLRTIGLSRTDVTEIIDDVDDARPTTPVDKPKMLRKMRSLGSLGERKASSFNLAGRQRSDAPAFDVDAMRRQRADYEARQKTEKRASNGT